MSNFIIFQTYNDKGTIVTIREKQGLPVYSKRLNYFICPECSSRIDAGRGHYCPECGVRILWEEYNKDLDKEDDGDA